MTISLHQLHVLCVEQIEEEINIKVVSVAASPIDVEEKVEEVEKAIDDGPEDREVLLIKEEQQ